MHSRRENKTAFTSREQKCIQWFEHCKNGMEAVEQHEAVFPEQECIYKSTVYTSCLTKEQERRKKEE